MPTLLDRRILGQLEEQAHLGLARSPPIISRREGVSYWLGEYPVVGFCSNDYLGLANHPLLSQVPAAPSGATSSRLVCGDLPEHRSIELRLAKLARSEDAVLFPSGFQLNVSVLPSLIQPSDRVHSDALNHASIIDGLRLSRATVHVLPHGQAPEPMRLAWWITESLFSMDGDFVDPAALRAHLAADGCLYLDEAHSFGLFTRDGQPTGFAGAHDIQPTALIATLGKSFACAGAFVAASATVCRWIRATARGFVFSTGTSPLLAAQLHQALDLVEGPEGVRQRERLWTNVDRFAAQFGVPSPGSPIFRLLLGSNDAAIQLSTRLLHQGWHVQAIRPPTVPHGTSRLRITITAAHERHQIDAFAQCLRTLL